MLFLQLVSEIYGSHHLLQNLLWMVILPQIVSPLEDDLFYFTSFNNVTEWAQVYDTCNINFNFKYRFEQINYFHFASTAGWAPPQPAPNDSFVPLFLSLDEENLPSSLTPIEIKHKETRCVTNSTKRNCVNHPPGSGNPPPVLMIYNNPPPQIGSYKISYGFQKNKECVTSNSFSPCFVNENFGKIRAVVLTAERGSLRALREQFEVETSNKFMSIINGGNSNNHERKFHEAIFMGSSEPLNCTSKRSSHLIDGKCYPMEIYMYFVDETLPTMALATILVIPVEVSEKENANIRPVVNAVAELYEEERVFLKTNDHITRDNRMFHHMGPSSVLRHNHNENDTDYFYIPSSIDVEKQISSMMDHFERVLTYRAKTFFTFEQYLVLQVFENSMVISTVQKTSTPFKNELLLDPATNEPIPLPEFLDKLDVNEYAIEVPRQVSDLTILKMKILRYFITEAYNAEIDNEVHTKKIEADYTIPKLDDAWLGVREGKPMPAHPEFKKLLHNYLVRRYEFHNLLVQKDELPTLEAKINKYQQVKKFSSNDETSDLLFDALRFIIEEACTHFGVSNKISAEQLLTDSAWTHDHNNFRKHLRRQMQDASELAQIRILLKNGLFTNGESLDEEYHEMGFFKRIEPNFRKHSLTYLGEFIYKDANFTWQNIYFKDQYVNGHLRTFLNTDNDKHDHPFLYNKYKKTEPRYGVIEYPEKVKLLLGNLGLTEKEADLLEKITPHTVFLKHSFQVSWLIPKGGGYYRYKGSDCGQISSPVPPCYGAQEVIVFRKPIKISREQLQILTTVPTSQLKSRDIFNTFGIRHPKRKTNNHASKYVLFDPRNHQFLVDDGFHPNSVLEYRNRKNKGNQASVIFQWRTGQKYLSVFLLVCTYFFLG